jgi:hypothetical protein
LRARLKKLQLRVRKLRLQVGKLRLRLRKLRRVAEKWAFYSGERGIEATTSLHKPNPIDTQIATYLCDPFARIRHRHLPFALPLTPFGYLWLAVSRPRGPADSRHGCRSSWSKHPCARATEWNEIDWLKASPEGCRWKAASIPAPCECPIPSPIDAWQTNAATCGRSPSSEPPLCEPPARALSASCFHAHGDAAAFRCRMHVLFNCSPTRRRQRRIVFGSLRKRRARSRERCAIVLMAIRVQRCGILCT